MFSSIDDVIQRLAAQQYITNRTIATVVYLASNLHKPILVEGPAGVGKTELAKVLAGALDWPLVRLQCYEGLDEAKALYEWEYAKQLLYTQILKDKIGEVVAGTRTLGEAVDRIAQEDDVFFSERFLLPRPLLRAITSDRPNVLLIDEIDKADSEFEAFLLEVLSDFQVTVPELGTLRARHHPVVVLTSNNAREMSDALKRRCLHLFIDFPDRQQELDIVTLKVPGVGAELAGQVVGLIQRVRKLDLKKVPSISETLDWARALVLLNVDTLDDALVGETLSVILKYEGDIRKAQQELRDFVEGQRAKTAAPKPLASGDKTSCTEGEVPMDAKVVEFCRLLRENGVRVSVAETMDGLRALGHVGLHDQETVRAALRASTVKRAADVAVFESLFDVFFLGLGKAIKATTDATADALSLDEDQLRELIEALEQMADEEGIDLSELARALLRGDTGTLERLLREAGERAGIDDIQHGFQEGRFTHALANALGMGGLTDQLGSLRDLGAMARRPDAERLRAYLDRRMQDLGELLKALVRQELDRRDVTRRERQGLQALAEKSFFYLTEEEMKRMQEAVTRLAQRLRNVVSLRRRRARRGTFDSSATLRRNLQYGGVPFRIVFDRRRKERPQIMVLCDVSDSVRNVSRFMLQFVYSLQDLYSRVRSFIFVADIGEVTNLFKEHDVNKALDLSLQGNVINVYSHSDFGRAFRAFHRDFLGAVNKRTTVLVLGDARNNYNLPHEWVLRDVQQRAKQVVWLNPENRMTWGFGDSEMDRYAPFCTMVEECRNLNQLYRVIDRLVAV